MKKAAKAKPKNLNKRQVLLICGGAVLLLILSAYLFRGWIRMTLEPGAYSVMHKTEFTNSMNVEMGKLGNPLETLGYNHIEVDGTYCKTMLAKGLSTQVSCYKTYSGYGPVPTNATGQAALNTSANNILAALKANGWQGIYSDDSQHASLTKLVKSLTSGVDWQPDAAYMKQAGGMLCMFDTNTAYSKPAPPAMASHFSCSKTFNIFGEPHFDQPMPVIKPH